MPGSANERTAIRRPPTPVVRVHPVADPKAICADPQFALHIKGMAGSESRRLLDFLYRRTRIHDCHHRHRWQAHRAVFRDNRRFQHDACRQRRLMERVTIKGDRPIGDAPLPDPPSSAAT